MFHLTARNVNDALPKAMQLLRSDGVLRSSRNGDVLEMPGPVMTTLLSPTERVLFSADRGANPFFHLVEAAWMLAGRDDLGSLTPYVKRMASYSDDGGKTSPGAYGKRWRGWFLETVGDQLDWAVRRLTADSTDRRVVIQMWDATIDPSRADNGGRDVPCNLLVLPRISGEQLLLSVCNRSHDVVWGLLGANAVHFSILHEYLAARLGLQVGPLTFFSNNFHAYLDTMPEELEEEPDPYFAGAEATPYPLFMGFKVTGDTNADLDPNRERIIREDLLIFFEHGPQEAATKARWPWVRQVLCPMAMAHQASKTRQPDRFECALALVEQVRASDWRMAGREWLKRAEARFSKAKDDGVQHG